MGGFKDAMMISDDAESRNNMVRSSDYQSVSQPALVPMSDGEDSSLDSVSSHHYRHEQHSSEISCSQSSMSKKRVSWDRIQTREYALVVGDHPLCQDGLPVSLDWPYHDTFTTLDSLDVSERKHSYVFPRRLSYEERQRRICAVSGLTVEQVKNEEIDLVVRTLREAWDQVSCNPAGEVADPMADMMIWDEIPGLDCDLTDISDFEWTESL